MKLFFLLVVVPVAIWGQDIAIQEPIPIDAPIRIRPPRPPPVTSSVAPRIIPKTQYVVVAPFRIRQGQPFNVFVTRFGVKKTIYIKLTISGKTESGAAFKPIVKYAKISSSSSRAFTSFDTSKIPKGTYFLTVKGENYKDTRALTYALKQSSVFIELNKAIFSPGQTVQGRLYAINSETNAVSPSSQCIITIADPDGNSVAVLNKIVFNKGKYEFNFDLAIRPPLGTWSISVQCGNEYAYEPFDVEEYKLPAYEINVNVPQISPLSDGKVLIIITAQYTFGEPVVGEGEFTIENWNGPSIKKTIQLVDGIASFELDFKNELQVPEWGSFYQYTFTMRDSILNSPGFTEGYFQVVTYAYTIELRGNNFITPGSSYKYTATIKKLDGSPAAQGTTVAVNVYPFGYQQILTVNAAGTASSTISIPADATYINLVATSKDSSDGYLYAYGPSSGSTTFIGLSVTTEKPKIGEWVRVTASVGENVRNIYYVITSKGVLITADKVSFRTGRRSASIWFKPTFAYAPYCQILAYYVNKAGDFVIGRTQVTLNDELPNYVKLGFREDTVAPGENYTFTVESKCDSTVSLRAIDQRVLLLKGGNDITKEEVMSRLYEYQYTDWLIYEDRPYSEYEYQYNDVGTISFTNIPQKPQPEYYYMESDMRRPEANQKDADRGGALPPSDNTKARKDFSETFCWTDVVTKSRYGASSSSSSSSSSSEEESSCCRAKVACKVPESLTKYLVYSVAMNTKYGLGLPQFPSNITTFLPFFIVVDLPYSVQRNEVLILDIAVFNNLENDQDVDIIVSRRYLRTPYFEGVDLEQFGFELVGATDYVKRVHAKAGENFKVQFALKFLFIGNYPFDVEAKGTLAGDAVAKQMRVLPEGIARTFISSALLVLNENDNSAEVQLQCNYPDGTYEDTKEVLTTVIGDLLGTALNNLEQLIQLPGGCGEQTLLLLVPNLAVHEYLITTNKLTPAIEAKLISYEEAGVQNQLSYRRSDGGFSAFGNQDPASSTWLTAYTVKAFYDASGYISVDANVITSGLDFIMTQQEDGKFIERGRVIHSDMQGGAGDGIAMTAYITIVLKSMLKTYPQYQTNYDNAINYLLDNVEGLTDVYELGIVAYALKLAGKETEATEAFGRFFALRIETPTTIQWQKTLNPPPYWYTAPSLDIEISSYGLKALIAFDRLDEAIKVVKYLMTQTNKFGGYGSSQDTVVALEALSLFARSFSIAANVQLSLTPNVGNQINVNIDSSNALTLQQFELDDSASIVDVAASTTTSGLAIVSLICNYYQDPNKVVPFFTVSYEFYRQCTYTIGFQVCTSYIPEGNSNMAIVRVKMPSGFRYQEWWGGPNNPDVSKVEVSNQGALVTFYFNTIGNKQSCIDVNAYRYNRVAELKPGVIIVNDYYDTAKEGSAKYDVPELSSVCYWGPR